MDLNIFKEPTQQEILAQTQRISAYTEIIAKGQTVDSFAGLQTLVRNGVVGTAVKAGDQLVAAWNGANHDWDVQGIDEACPVDPTKTHTLDILAHPVLANITFDQPQYEHGGRAGDHAGIFRRGAAAPLPQDNFQKGARR